jgi:hypothetical protein
MTAEIEDRIMPLFKTTAVPRFLRRVIGCCHGWLGASGGHDYAQLSADEARNTSNDPGMDRAPRIFAGQWPNSTGPLSLPLERLGSDEIRRF